MSRFQPSTLRRVALGTGLTCIALMLADIVLAFIDRNAVLPPDLRTWSLQNVLNATVNIAVPVIGLVLTIRRPENPIGWVFLLAGIGIAFSGFGTDYAIHALRVDPGSLPFPRVFVWIANWIWPVAIFMLIFLFLLFPDGHLRSRRWRWVAQPAGVALALLVFGSLLLATATWSQPLKNNTTTPPGLIGVVATVVFVVAFASFPIAIIASFVSVVLRYRSSVGEERLQLRWFVTAAGLVAVIFALSFPFSGFAPAFFNIASPLALLFLYAAIAIAVLKYRLYEIDVVIGRTVVFALLAAFITGVYVALVVGVGTLVGNSRSPLLSALAAAVIAVAFQPVRQWARRLANRVVYGKRATPYEVLSGFAERAAETYSTEDVLPRLVRVLAEGIGATEARVWLSVGQDLRLAAAWPVDGQVPPLRLDGPDRLPAFPESERAFPVRHGGELLGAISVVTSASDPLGPDRQRLVEDVAAQTGLVLRNVRLIEELRESRRRIVAAQDVRAKALERNIHDGAQQQLVALGVKLRILGQLVERDPEKSKSLAAELQAESTDALENLRDLARGIYPPLLADKGLAAALESQARKSAVPVSVQAVGLGRYPQEIEAAVYFCCLEALQNIAKYAKASTATVRLEDLAGTLMFEVTDDGAGFDPAATGFGTGLQGMADRLDALAGSLDVRSAREQGTTVAGRVPGLQS
jgi:signal transduction histidine kinase